MSISAAARASGGTSKAARPSVTAPPAPHAPTSPIVESRGTFYCGNAYGRLAEHDLESGYALRSLDAQNGNSGSLWPARDGTELVSFADYEPVVVPLAPRRLGTDHPRRRPRVEAVRLQPGR